MTAKKRPSMRSEDVEARRVQVAAMVQAGHTQSTVARETGASHTMVRNVTRELSQNPSGKLAARGEEIQKELLNRMSGLTSKSMDMLQHRMDTSDGDESLRDVAVVYGIVADKWLKASGLGGTEQVSVSLVVDSLSSKEPATIDVKARPIDDE